MNYQKYLRSEHWQGVRRLWVESGQLNSCIECGDEMYELHHKTYEHLWEEKLEDLEPLCRKHHRERHGLLSEDGFEVFKKRQPHYREVFAMAYGPFPHPCYFCGDMVEPWKGRFTGTSPVIHHIDASGRTDHPNNHPSNLAPAHNSCHIRHHTINRSPEALAKIAASSKARAEKDPIVQCRHCGKQFKGKHRLGRHEPYCHENPNRKRDPSIGWATKFAKVECPHCGQSLLQNNLANHILCKHSKEALARECAKREKTKKNQECRFCGMRLKTGGGRSLHERHCLDNPERMPYPKGLKTHWSPEERAKRKGTCPHCNLTYSSLSNHVGFCQANPERLFSKNPHSGRTGPRPRMVCPYCKLSFGENGAGSHVPYCKDNPDRKSRSKQSPLKERITPEAYERICGIQRDRAARDPILDCPHCERKVKGKHHLATHLKSHKNLTKQLV